MKAMEWLDKSRVVPPYSQSKAQLKTTETDAACRSLNTSPSTAFFFYIHHIHRRNLKRWNLELSTACIHEHFKAFTLMPCLSEKSGFSE